MNSNFSKLTVRFFLIIVLILTKCAFAQEYQRIEELAELFLEQTKLPGISMAISKDGEIVYAKGFGQANLKASIPMDSNMQFRTASIAKVLTATALGRLATEGKLNFDDTIGMHVTYIDKQYKDLTIRQLAGHTSGLQHRPSRKGYKNKQFVRMKETLPFITAPLLFEPNSAYQYSTNAFNLLGVIIEEVSGLSYEDYMQEYIFKPLKMMQTFAENISKLSSNDVQLYYMKNGKPLKEKLTNGSYKLPGAGFRSTPTDLVKLTNAYTNGMISKEVVAQMFKNNILSNEDKTNVGITWRLSKDIFGNQAMEHAGSWRGARTVLVYYPEEELAISLMINATCQVLIEETAHIFTELFRISTESLTKIDVNQNVTVRYNSKEGIRLFNGLIQVEGNRGFLKTEADNFLAYNELFKISETIYVMITDFGLLYLETSENNVANGKVYAYSNRNEINPKEKPPLIEFFSEN
ncbi:serine hydrolase domain-containing protein [uncultured Croceitalea sp.]|uniref:serine hydrolase domain-containing protein n=1 Tax=uncultured Croceitalea sp. TaxID=1798908 RepID=UPI003305C3B9